MSRLRRAPIWSGTWLIVVTMLTRLMTHPSRVPWWDTDPTRAALPESTLRPSMSLALDALVWLGAVCVLGGCFGRLLRREVLLAFGVVIGSVGVLLHGYWLTPIIGVAGVSPAGSFDSLVRGSMWSAALMGAVSIAIAVRNDPQLRRVVIVAVLGAAAMLVAKGLHQVLIEHPSLVRTFEQDRAGVLRAQGLDPDSTAARLYERRLRHAEATGWLGLSNAYGSLLAGLLVAWAALLVRSIRFVRKGLLGSGEAGLLSIVAAASALGLWLSGSKGSIAAGLIGAALLGAFATRNRFGALVRRSGSMLALALPALVLLGVVARGLIGERLSELSILFRWHYLVGASRIVVDHSLVGVGPSLFKDAYLLARPPLSPEEVDSPHSLPLDWLATLGLFGLVWLVVWLVMLWRSGRGLCCSERDEPFEPGASVPTGARRAHVCWIASAVIVSIFMASLIGWAALTPTEQLAIAVGAIVWLSSALVTMRLLDRDPSAASAALSLCAITIALHSMIEVTLTLQGSAPIALALLGLACAQRRAEAETTEGRRAGVGVGRWALLATMAGLGLAMTVVPLARAIRWETSLRAGAQTLAPAARLAQTIERARGAPPSQRPAASRAIEAAVGEASTALRVARPSSAHALPAFLAEVSIRTRRDAIAHLSRADRLVPTNIEPRIRAARLHMDIAALSLAQESSTSDALASLDAAEADLRALVTRYPESSRAWAQLGSMLEARAGLIGDDRARSGAIEAWERVAQLDPFGLRPALRLATLHDLDGSARDARRWAEQALEIDRLKRLDPLKRLTDGERAEMERMSGSSP